MKIVCLANSFRVGGRCLGGIELDNNNNPVFVNNRPKWIRPVLDTAHEEVPSDLVAHISLLDIVEFTAVKTTGHGHQSENVLFEENSIETKGSFPMAGLTNIVDNNRYSLIFGNRGAAVPENIAENLSFSLMLLTVTEFEVNERVFEGKPYPQVKLSFRHNNNIYNFPITDPSFLNRYGSNHNVLHNKDRIYISLSLTAPHNEWSYKLIAGIIFDSAVNIAPVDDYDDNLPF